MNRRDDSLKKLRPVWLLMATLFFLCAAVCTALLFRNFSKMKELKLEKASLQAEISGAESEAEELRERLSRMTESAETSSAEETSSQAVTEEPAPGVPERNRLEEDYRYRVANEYENLGVIVNIANFLNVRETPGMDGNILGKGTPYAAFEIIGEEGDWYRIRVGELEGYVHRDYVVTGQTAVIYAMEHCNVDAYAIQDGVSLYRSPDESGTVAASLNPQGHYIVLDTVGDWVKLLVYDTVVGYVKSDKLGYRYSMTEPFFFTGPDGKITLSEDALNIINTAFDYYGGAYVWGGTKLGTGVDCSGFTLRIFEKYGYMLPRLSSEQASAGTKVDSMAEAKPGDLLFFHGYRNGTVTAGVGHVAIYIGNGKMIHAASEARGITVDTYNFLEEPIGIRRIIND